MPEVTRLDELSETPHAQVFAAGEPRTVRLALAAGESVPEHTHPDSNVVLAVLSGALRVALDDETHDLAAGDVVRFDGRRSVSPEATEDAVALVVLAEK